MRGCVYMRVGSYVNYYIGNSVVVVPLLDHRTDDNAISLLQTLFPERKVRVRSVYCQGRGSRA